MKRIILSCLIVSVCFIPKLISADNHQIEKTIEVGYVPDSPPYQFYEDGLNKGFNIDVMNQIAKNLNLTVNYIPMTQYQSVNAMSYGDVDVLLGVPFTKKNDAIMDFTEPYVTSEISILAHKDNQIEKLEDINQAQVALQLNSLEYEFMKNIRNIDLHASSRQDVSFKILMHDRADIFVGNYFTAKYLLKSANLEKDYQFIENKLIPIEYSFAVKKENYHLLNQLNAGINDLKLSNEYTTIYNQWFERLDTPMSEKLKKLLQITIVIIIIGVIIFLLSLRWNRELQREVNKKTKDLQQTNETLERQIKKTLESEQTKDQVLESSLRGVMTLNLDGTVLTINHVACEMFRVDQSVIGKKFKDVILMGDELEEKILRVLETKEKHLDQLLNVSEYLEDIEYITYDIQPIYNHDQAVTGVLLFALDITEEKKLQEYLFEEEKSQILIQLVAGLVHEIRNPLTSIKTFVEMIPQKIDNLKFREEIATHVPREIDRLNKLLESLINYAKPKGNHSETIDLSDLVYSSALIFKNNIANKGYDLNLNIEKNLEIKGDIDQIKQVLINIILNAMESIKQKDDQVKTKPTITIHLYQHAENNIIEIIDNGMGMSAETQNRLFEPFYTTKSEGTGLGLGLSKQFIKENKGEIFLESELNKGSKFTLVFKRWEQSDE